MSIRSTTLPLSAALVSFALWVPEARACGGFFCNNQPLDQAGEKILFIVDSASGTVTAHIQIQYEGSAPDFSWVVPVQSVPTFDVGSDEVFTRLLGPTQPVFSVRQSTRGGCDACPSPYFDPSRGEDGAVDGDADSDFDTDTGSGGGVEIVDSGVVGPFETVTLTSDDPEALETWLVDNGYDVPPTAGPIIAAYVAANFYFVGLKLTKDADSGDLAPIVLEMPATTPCIPLRLTAIAATPDMPVYAWVLGDSLAVSTNYLDVVPNDVLVLTGAMSWIEAVRGAIDAAGGRAFVREYAADSASVRASLDNGYDTTILRGIDSPVDVMDELRRQGFLGSALLLAILAEHMPPPAGVEGRDFYNCPDCYDLTGYTFDSNALADALEERIVRPLDEVHDAFWRFPMLTRLYTVISPNEMTEDPEFAMSPWAEWVPRERFANVVRDCRGTLSFEDDYGEATTPSGHRFCGADVSGGWGWGGGYYGYYSQVISGYTPGEMPVLERAVLYGDGYSPEVIVDERENIDAALTCDVPALDHSAATCDDAWEDYDPYGDGGGDGDADADLPAATGDGSLCSAVPGGGAAATPLWLLLVAAVSFLRRRVSR